MIEVIHAGIYNSIQDLGRIGMSALGISRGGAMDFDSFSLANALLQNDINDACIEISFGSGVFRFLKPTFICLTGADFSPMINQKSAAMNTPIMIGKGDELSFGKREYGVYTYLGVQGGIQSELTLNSRCQFKNITQNFKLDKGDQLRILPLKEDIEFFTNDNDQKHLIDGDRINCYPGPEFSLLNSKQKRLLTQPFRLSKDCNRIGVVLEEEIPNEIPQILSSAVLPGTVQLTPSGKLIILQRGCQTTGGYPRILQLDNFSINRLSQKFTNDYLRFSLLSST